MDPIQTLLFGVLAPAVLAGLVLAIGWKLWRAPSGVSGGPSGESGAGSSGDIAAESTNSSWSGSLAIGVAFAAGFLLMLGSPASFLPESERTPTGLDWVFWFSLPCALLLPVLARTGAVFLLLRIALGAVLIRFVLRSQFDSGWQGPDGWQWLAGLTALFVVQWSAFERLGSPRSELSSPLVLWLLAAGVATLAGLTGSAKIGQLGGTIAAALGAAAVIGWRRPEFNLSGSGAAMVSTLLFGLGLNAYFYSYTPGQDILLAACAPLLALMPTFLVRDWSTTKKTALAMGLAALPLAVGITSAVIEMLNEADEYDYY
jgi:hypothetical protein